jgi:hypothetical protein
MFNFGVFNHRNIYLFGLILLVCSLPFSVYFMSVSQFVIIGNWILEGSFREKWQRFKSDKGIWLFASIFIVHMLGMAFTTMDHQCVSYGLNDMRVKLPILLLPFFIGTSTPLKLKELRWVLNFFVAAVIVGTIITNVAIMLPGTHPDYRSFSMFISHIRFSLMIVMSIFILVYFLFESDEGRLFKIFLWMLMAWLLLSLFMLRVLTGIIILYIAAVVLFGVFNKMMKRPYRVGLLFILIAIPLVSFIYIREIAVDYYMVKQRAADLPECTQSGRKYLNDTVSKEYENGYLVWVDICEEEMKKEWDAKSSLPYDSLDLRGNGLKYTLIRYMTSMGFTKDSAGITKLTPTDIENIESGIANIKYVQKHGLYTRIYETIWELDHYFKYNDPSGHSLTQRFEFMKTSARIIKENFWIGVGTGDVQKAFDDMYEKMRSPLDIKYRHRAHNQFVTLLISFGIFGFLWILFVLFYLPFRKKLYSNYLFLSSFLVVMLSWLNEDTLETQAGVTFFSFFIILFLFGTTLNQDEKQKAE